tara:strand:- start:714 stop:1088 length:375 start_codon:yes stop_codon:yes gene_type:complete
MKSDDSIISSKPIHAKFSAHLSKPINSLNRNHNLANLAKIDNLAKIKTLAKNVSKQTNQNYVATVQRSAKFPIDELQRRVLKKLRPRYSVDGFKELLANLDHISGFERLAWLRAMELKFKNEKF